MTTLSTRFKSHPPSRHPAGRGGWSAFTVALLGCGTILLAMLPGNAQETSADPLKSRIVFKAQANATECSCRVRGQNLPVGSEICLDTPKGASLFKCQMDQNVTSWRPLASPCPQS